MSFNSWLQNLGSARAPRRGRRHHRRRGSLRTTTHRPNLEALEDRCLLSFNPAVNYPVGLAPQAVAVGDFNGDTRLDLATTSYSSSDVSVLLGNADGTFQAAQNSATGANPRSVAVGDFNDDGKLDLATANANDVSVLLGNGNGTFQPASNFGIGSDNPLSAAVGDFNADGKLDLEVTSNLYFFDGCGYYSCYSHYEGHANVLLGSGTGTFAAPSTTVLNSAYPVAVAVTDVNADGKVDLVSANSDSWTVSVLLGDGSGNLLAPTDFYAGGTPVSVAAGDVNGDSQIDLVTANGYGTNVSVLLGDGAGEFGAAQTYAAGNYLVSVVLADFNNDTRLDIATASGYGNGVSVLLGRGNGTFSPPVCSAAGTNAWAVAAGDFNGDGWLDAATANFSVNNVSVSINDHTWPAPDAPSVSINDVMVTEGNTGSTNATFTVTLSAAYNQDVTVHYQTANDSATAGSDYTAASGDVTVAKGSTTQTFTIAALGDRLPEPAETFVVNLSTANAFVAGQGVGTILDDEPQISINDVTVTEGNTGSVNATFTVTLSAIYDQDVTVHFDTANGSATAGSDYTAASGNVTVAARSTTQTFAVAVLGDRLPEPNETFVVNLGAATNGFIVDGQGQGTIADDEPRISISDVTKAEGKNRQTTLFTFTVTLSAAYDQAVTMSYHTMDGTGTTGGKDYVAKTGTLTFAPGEISKTITIVVNGDNRKESNETIFLDLFGNSSNSLFTKSRGIGTILNDDRR